MRPTLPALRRPLPRVGPAASVCRLAALYASCARHRAWLRSLSPGWQPLVPGALHVLGSSFISRPVTLAWLMPCSDVLLDPALILQHHGSDRLCVCAAQRERCAIIGS